MTVSFVSYESSSDLKVFTVILIFKRSFNDIQLKARAILREFSNIIRGVNP